jgi:hypothetical protein
MKDRPRSQRLKDDARSFGSNVRKMFKESNQTPAEEAAAIAAASSAAGQGISGYASRWQKRLRFSIRWLEALEETAKYAEEAFGQVAEEALIEVSAENEINEQNQPDDKPPYTVTEFPADFATDNAGETEKIAGTEPPPPMNREQRRRAAAEGKPAGPPKGPQQTPPKDKPFKGQPGHSKR